MLEMYIRPIMQSGLNKMAQGLMTYNITPNMLTACALITGMCGAIAIAFSQPLLTVPLLIVSGLADILDGTVAQLSKQQHPFGAYFDLISDRLVESAIIVGFAWASPEHVFSYLFFFTALLFHFSTYIAAGALFPNRGEKSIHHEQSYIERPEAFIVLCFLAIFPRYLYPVLSIFSLLIFGDAIARFYRVYQTYSK